MAHRLQCTKRLQGRSPRVEPRAQSHLAGGRQLRGMPPLKAPVAAEGMRACSFAAALGGAKGFRPAHKRGAAFV